MAVVKADGYGHGMVEVAAAARDAGADWLGVATIEEALALRAAGDHGPLLCWLSAPGDDFAAAVAAGIEVTAYSVAELDEIAAVGRAPGCSSRSTPACRAAERPAPEWQHLFAVAATSSGRGGSTSPGSGPTSRPATSPPTPPTTPRRRPSARRSPWPTTAGLDPDVTHLANSAAAILRPSSHFDLVRCGIATYGLDPAPGVSPRLGLRPAMTVRARLVMSKAVRAGEGVSYGHTWARRPRTPPSASCRPATARACRAPPATPPRVGRRLPAPIRGRVCMDQLVVDLARRAAAGRDRGGPLRSRRPRRAHRPGLGGRRRHDQLRDRDPRRRPAGPQARRHRRTDAEHRGLRKDHPLSIKGRIFGTVVGAAGLAAAAGAVGIARQNRVIGNRAAGEDVAFGSLHSAPRCVVADDAHRPARRGRRAGATSAACPPPRTT